MTRRGIHGASQLALSVLLTLAGTSVAWAAVAQANFEDQFRTAVEASRQNRLDDASKAFAECLRIEPNSAEAWFNSGLVRLRQGKTADAASQLQRALQLNPQMRGIHLLLGMAQYRLARYADAQASLKEAAKKEPSSADAYMWLGMAESAMGNEAASVDALQTAAKLRPNDSDILFHLGRAYMNLSKQTYERMYQANPGSWRVHQVLCSSFDEADRPEDAVKECTQAINLKPNEPGLHQMLGDIHWKQNHLDLAEAEFSKELEVDPENDTSTYKLATIEIERSKPEEARKLLATFLERHPESGEGHYQLGRAEAQLNEEDAAIRDFSAVVKNPASARTEVVQQSYYQLAQLYRRKHQPEESKLALDSFLRMKQEADAQQNGKLEDKMKRANEQQAQ